MDVSQYVLLGAVIAGITELLSRVRARDFWVAATIVCAAIVGGLFGAFNYGGVPDAVNGIAIGFGASGALTAIGIFGNRSKPAPSDVTTRVK